VDGLRFRRKAADVGMRWTFRLCAFLVILPLFLIFFDLVAKGAGSSGGPS
jgi:hypothetical protein